MTTAVKLLLLLQLLVTTTTTTTMTTEALVTSNSRVRRELRKMVSGDGHQISVHRASDARIRPSSTTAGGADTNDAAVATSSLPATGDVKGTNFTNNYRKRSSSHVIPSPSNDEETQSGTSDCHRLGLSEATEAVFRQTVGLRRNTSFDETETETQTNHDKMRQLFRELRKRFSDNRTIVLCKVQPKKMSTGRHQSGDQLNIDEDSTLSRIHFGQMFRQWKEKVHGRKYRLPHRPLSEREPEVAKIVRQWKEKIHGRKYRLPQRPPSEREPEVAEQTSLVDPTFAMESVIKTSSETGNVGNAESANRESVDSLLSFSDQTATSHEHQTGNKEHTTQPAFLASTTKLQQVHRIVATDSPTDNSTSFSTDLRFERARHSVRRVRHHSSGHMRRRHRLHRHLHHHNIDNLIGDERSTPGEGGDEQGTPGEGTNDREYVQCIAGQRFPVMNLIYLKHVETVMRSRGCWSDHEERLAIEVFNRSTDEPGGASDKSFQTEMQLEHRELSAQSATEQVDFSKNNYDKLRQRCQLQMRYVACRHRRSRDVTGKGRRRKTGHAVSGGGRRGLPYSWSQQVSDIMSPTNNISMIFY